MTTPDFIIIGAMKCGTTTLAAQLGAQTGIFMTDPKEPNFFSDDAVYAKGNDWYGSLFDTAKPGDILGEASTHYSKLPTHPHCIERMQQAGIAPKLIYLIRDPVERAISHYIHEWTMGVITEEIDPAFSIHPEIIAYSCYARQLAPYVSAFGPDRILLLSLEYMKADPQAVLKQACEFLGFEGTPRWQEEQAQMNVSSDRIRRFPLHGLLIDNPVAAALRRALVPQKLRDRIKAQRQIGSRPKLSPATEKNIRQIFATDFAQLHQLFPGRGDLREIYPFLGQP